MVTTPSHSMARLQRLALARTRAAFAAALEGQALELLGQGQARFLSEGWEAGSAPARAAESLDLVRQGAEAAVPLTLHGSLVGVLSLSGVEAELPEALLDLAHGAGVAYELAATREDTAAFETALEDLLVRAVEGLSAGRGHTLRVARVATELAQLLDMSVQSRTLLWKAAVYHDVGKLVLAGSPPGEVESEHARAGADFLGSTRRLAELAPLVDTTHRPWRGETGHLEAWVLALAEDVCEQPEADPEALLARVEARHHPAVVDALQGLLVSGRLKELLL